MTTTYEIEGQTIRVEGLPSPGPFKVIFPDMTQVFVRTQRVEGVEWFNYRGKLYRSLRTAVECAVLYKAVSQ